MNANNFSEHPQCVFNPETFFVKREKNKVRIALKFTRIRRDGCCRRGLVDDVGQLSVLPNSRSWPRDLVEVVTADSAALEGAPIEAVEARSDVHGQPHSVEWDLGIGEMSEVSQDVDGQREPQ